MLLSTVQTARQRRAARRAGFTLIEILVVVGILVILAGVASISLFKYLDQAKVNRAKMDMQAIKKCYESYYATNTQWPEDPSQVYPLLEQGQQAFVSPWGPNVIYQVQLQEVPQNDGSTSQRPVVTCQPPGQPMIYVPDINAGR